MPIIEKDRSAFVIRRASAREYIQSGGTVTLRRHRPGKIRHQLAWTIATPGETSRYATSCIGAKIVFPKEP